MKYRPTKTNGQDDGTQTMVQPSFGPRYRYLTQMTPHHTKTPLTCHYTTSHHHIHIVIYRQYFTLTYSVWTPSGL